MAELLFKLHNVPVDEIIQVRQRLEENDIDFYETDSGAFGVGVSAIWLSNNTQLEQAKLLLNEYQAERTETAQKENTHQNLWDSFKKAPLRFVFSFAVVAAILYLSTSPFFIS